MMAIGLSPFVISTCPLAAGRESAMAGLKADSAGWP